MPQLTPDNTTYTNPGGLTPQALQTAQSNAVMGNAASLPPAQELGQAYVDTTKQLAGMQTPQAREQVVANSDVPAMQTNYDDLARQLYEYDKMYLSPKYAAPPTAPGDALNYGRVGSSQLSQLTPEMAAGETTLYADNPKYAVNSQAFQQNSILDLLSSLNNSIDRELKSAKGKYASSVDSQKSVLESIAFILGKKLDAEEKANARAESAALKAENEKARKIDKFNAEANRVLTKFAAGAYSMGNPDEAWGKAFEDLKGFAQREGVYGNEVNDESINTALGGGWDPTTQQSWGNATPDALRNLKKQKGLDANQRKGLESAEGSLGLVTRMLENYQKASSLGGLATQSPLLSKELSSLDPAARDYLSDSQGALSSMKELAGESGVLSNQDTSRLSVLIPSLTENRENGTKSLRELQNRVKRGILRKQGLDAVITLNGASTVIKNGDLLKPWVEEALMAGAEVEY